MMPARREAEAQPPVLFSSGVRPVPDVDDDLIDPGTQGSHRQAPKFNDTR